MAKLTTQEIDDYLGQPHVAHLVTLRRSGSPHVAPVWFVWGNGRVFIMADGNSTKVRNIRRNSAVTLSIAPDQRPYSYVVLEGQARITSENLAQVVEQLCVRYDGPVRGKQFAAELLGDERMVLIDVGVDRVISWKDDD